MVERAAVDVVRADIVMKNKMEYFCHCLFYAVATGATVGQMM
jgi:hypothetical protein